MRRWVSAVVASAVAVGTLVVGASSASAVTSSCTADRTVIQLGASVTVTATASDNLGNIRSVWITTGSERPNDPGVRGSGGSHTRVFTPTAVGDVSFVCGFYLDPFFGAPGDQYGDVVTVRVEAPPATPTVTVNPAASTIAAGSTTTVTASGTNPTVSGSPNWSATGACAVDATGVVTGTQAGTCTVSATFPASTDPTNRYQASSGSTVITVTPVVLPVPVVTVTAPATLKAGEVSQLGATAPGVPAGTPVSWSAAPAATCSITASGVVTASLAGDCVVTATFPATAATSTASGSATIRVTSLIAGQYGTLSCKSAQSLPWAVPPAVLVEWAWTGKPAHQVKVTWPVTGQVTSVTTVTTASVPQSAFPGGALAAGTYTVTLQALTAGGLDAGVPAVTCPLTVGATGAVPTIKSPSPQFGPDFQTSPSGELQRRQTGYGGAGLPQGWQLWSSAGTNGPFTVPGPTWRTCNVTVTEYFAVTPVGSSAPSQAAIQNGVPVSAQVRPPCTPAKPPFFLPDPTATGPGSVVAPVFPASTPGVLLELRFFAGEKPIATVPVTQGSTTPITCLPSTVTAVYAVAYYPGAASRPISSKAAPITVAGPLPATCPTTSGQPSATGGASSGTTPGGPAGTTSSGSPGNTPSGGGDDACLSRDGRLYPDLRGSVGSSLMMAPNTRTLSTEVRYSVTGGRLPAGLALDPFSGNIYGTPTENAVGRTTVVISAVDAGLATSESVTITVDNLHHSLSYPVRVETAVGDLVRVKSVAHDAAAGGRYRLVCGTLPDGMSLDPKTGALTGTPTTLVQSPVPLRVRLADKNGSVDASFILEVATQAEAALTYPYHVHLGYRTPTIIEPYTYFPEGSTFYLTGGTLPKGMQLDRLTGVISGTATVVTKKPRVLTVTVVDALGGQIDSETFDVSVRKLPVPLTVVSRKAANPVPRGTQTVLVSKVSNWSGTTLVPTVTCKGCRVSVNPRTGRVAVRPGSSTKSVTVTYVSAPKKSAKDIYGVYVKHGWKQIWRVQ